jgi:hypothetical protein
MITNNKAIISGDTLELYDYFDTPLEYAHGRSRDKLVGPILEFNGHKYGVYKDSNGQLWERQIREKEISIETKEDYLRRSIQRASTKIRRLASANHNQYKETETGYFKTKHLTLTLQDPNLTFLEQTNPFFTSFARRINRHLYGREDRNLRYLAVPERQERGVIHYHTLLFNMPYIEQRRLQDIWEQGLPEIEAAHGIKGIVFIAVRDNPKVVMYLTKYLVKNFSDPTLEGKRKYFPSVNLLRPEIVYDENRVKEIKSFVSKEYLTYNNTFNTKYNGKVGYSMYTLPKNFLTSLTGGTFAQL